MINIEINLPDFARMIYNYCKEKKAEAILMHHSAFSEDEYDLFGSAVKFAAIKGCNLLIICDVDKKDGEQVVNHNDFSVNDTEQLGRTIKELCLNGKDCFIGSQKDYNCKSCSICLN
jgi:hypothetical protein